jgi:hypothetical protein
MDDIGLTRLIFEYLEPHVKPPYCIIHCVHSVDSGSPTPTNLINIDHTYNAFFSMEITNGLIEVEGNEADYTFNLSDPNCLPDLLQLIVTQMESAT